MPSARTPWSLNIWRWSLGCFVLAAATGAFMRFGLLQGFPWGLLYGDIRHAHSHLMFFGWGTPVLMLLVLRLSGAAGSRAARILLSYTLVIALASFLPFLLSGYGMLPVFGRPLPISMMTAGLSGLAWLGFIVLYWLRARQASLSAPGGNHFLVSVLLLLVASVGVAGLAVAGMQHAGPVLINALAIFYVEVFAEGWFGVALIGIAYRLLPGVRATAPATAGLWLLGAALTLRSTADVLVKTGTPAMEPLTFIGSALAGAGLLLTLAPLWPALRSMRPSAWHLSLLLLAAKGVFDLLLAVPALAAMSDAAGLRVFYLHAFLLGAFSIGMIASARTVWGAGAFRFPWLFSAAVLVMLAALLPVSGAWPRTWSGRWAFSLAAWTSIGPVAVALVSLLTSHKADATGRPTPDLKD